MGEHNQEPTLNNKIMHFLMKGSPFSPTLCSPDWLSQWDSTQLSCGSLPGEQRWLQWVHTWTDMGLKWFLKCFFFDFFFKSRTGLSALRGKKSAGSSSASTKHKVTKAISSADADFAFCRVLEGCEFGRSCGWSGLLVESLFNDLDLENSLEGEKEGRVGEKGI